MTQYLIILLDDTAVSFCHYTNHRTERRVMPMETLKKGIMFGMKENLNIQFVYPDYALPAAYNEAIETIDHCKIKPLKCSTGADVVVIDGLDEAKSFTEETSAACVLRLTKAEMFSEQETIKRLLGLTQRLNVVITDVETLTDADLPIYNKVLEDVAANVEQMYADGASPQLNLLTDRMMLDKMNNCGAGDTTVTLAPDGQFYVCPAFYQSADGYAVGSIGGGLDIKNRQLYDLKHAPICRHCDAYQCKRCVWLNRKTTLEVNTPSHEQCIVAHTERNISRQLLHNIRKHGEFLAGREIKEINYLDPFEVKEKY